MMLAMASPVLRNRDGFAPLRVRSRGASRFNRELALVIGLVATIVLVAWLVLAIL